MFKEWLNKNGIENVDFSFPLFPPAKDRKFWDERHNPSVIKRAERFLDFTWPQIKATDYMAFMKEGNRVKQEKPHMDRRSGLISLVFGELMEYKGRFLPDIVNGIFTICEETFWGLSAHHPPVSNGQNIPSATNHYVDIYAAQAAELLAVTYYLLYDELMNYCPEILERVEYETQRRIIAPYLQHTDFWWMGYYDGDINNWNPWIISNILTVLLITEKRRTVFNTALKKMFNEIQRYYDSVPNDGGCDEGSSYWTASGAKLFEFCEQLYRATNGEINFFSDEKLKNIGKYIYRVYIGSDFVVNFADGGSKLKQYDITGLVYLFGKRINDLKLASFAKTLKAQRDKTIGGFNCNRVKYGLFTLIYEKDIDSLDDYVPDDECILPDLQCAFARQNGWYYAAKGGHNKENHNHNDVGSFIACFENVPILIDPGRPTYTKETFSDKRYEIWAMQSLWHNLPQINGQQQQSGITFRADKFVFSDKKTKISFAKAYAESALLSNLEREIGFIKDGVEITDNFEFSKGDNTVCERFITPFDVEITENAVLIDRQFILESDIKCEISLETVDIGNEKALMNNWKTDKIKCVKFGFKAAKTQKIKIVLRRM